jgi:hypothetical protein
MLDLDVRDRRLPANPAKGVRLPPVAHHTAAVPYCGSGGGPGGRVRALPLVVRFLAYTGLHWGEMAALRVCDIHPLAAAHAHLQLGDRGQRPIHLRHDTDRRGAGVQPPGFLAEQVAASVAGKGAHDLLFEGTRGDRLRNGTSTGARSDARPSRSVRRTSSVEPLRTLCGLKAPVTLCYRRSEGSDLR